VRENDPRKVGEGAIRARKERTEKKNSDNRVHSDEKEGKQANDSLQGKKRGVQRQIFE